MTDEDKPCEALHRHIVEHLKGQGYSWCGSGGDREGERDMLRGPAWVGRDAEIASKGGGSNEKPEIIVTFWPKGVRLPLRDGD